MKLKQLKSRETKLVKSVEEAKKMNNLERFKQFLKDQGLEDSQIEKITKAMPAAKIYLASEDNLDSRYQKLKGQKELLDEQLKTANGTIETLKKDNGSNEELQKEVQKYKDANKDLQTKYDKDVVAVEKKQLLINALGKEGAIHPDLLVASMDLSKIELKDGKISGHKDAIKSLKENYKDQFKIVEDPEGNINKDPYNYNPPGGGEIKGNNADIFAAMEEFSVRK